MGLDKDTDMKKIIQSVYKAVSPSPEFNQNMLRELSSQSSKGTVSTSTYLWYRPSIWLSIAGVVILVVIVYGVLLANRVSAMLLP